MDLFKCFSRQTLPMVLRHILRHTKVLKEVNASLLNPVQSEAEKCPQGDHEARSSSTLLKAFSQGKPSMKNCLPLLKLLRYSTLRNLNVQAEPLTGEWCQLKLYLDKAPCEPDSALQVPSEATVWKSGLSSCEALHTCSHSGQRKSHVSPRANMVLPGTNWWQDPHGLLISTLPVCGTHHSLVT